jgi:predicted metal-dependent phosphotriesterase family hydrolase
LGNQSKRCGIFSAQSMHWFGTMDKDSSIDVIVKRTEIGRGRRIVFMVAVLFAVAGLIGVVAAGFHGRNIPQNAAAMTTPAPATTKTGWRPWWLQ